MLTRFSNTAAAWLLAPRCASCRARLDRPLSAPVCDDCWGRVTRLSPPWCDRCGDRLARADAHGESLCARCREHPPSFSVARSATLFAGPVRELIHTFKYERRRGLAAPLAQLMLESGKDVLDEADAVVPVPLHPIRSLRRGFNQADDLACCLG